MLTGKKKIFFFFKSTCFLLNKNDCKLLSGNEKFGHLDHTLASSPPEQAPREHLPSAERPALVLCTAPQRWKIGQRFMLSFSLAMLGWQWEFLCTHLLSYCCGAETWLGKVLFSLPFSLQLPCLAARAIWKLCREAEIQEHIWVFSFSTLSPWKEQDIIYKTEGDGNKAEVDLHTGIPAHTAAPTLSRSCPGLLLGRVLPRCKALLSVTQKGAF